MKPEDIVVGKKYTHSYHGPSEVWLGCGMRKLFTDSEYTEKRLVLIKSDSPEHIGKMFQMPENAHDGMWDFFQEQGSGDTLWIMHMKG